MQLTITKAHLLRALAATSGPLGTNSTLPILSSLCVRAADGLLRLASTNLDQFMDVSVPCEVSAPGAIAIPGKKFSSIIRELTGEEVTLHVDGKNVLKIECGNSRFHLRGLDATEFPPVPNLKEPLSVTLTQAGLRQMLVLTSFCCSTEDSRFVLQGVTFLFTPHQIEIAATDGRRAAATTNRTDLDAKRQIIVPSKAIKDLIRLLDEEGDVTVAMSEKQVQFTLGDVSLTSVLIDGSFPNYRQVFPQVTGRGVALDRLGFLAALRRVQIISEMGVLHFSPQELRIQSKPNDKEQSGDATETLEATREEKLSIAFNLDYVTEPLQHLDEEKLEFHATLPEAPALLRCAERAWEYVVMPVRLT